MATQEPSNRESWAKPVSSLHISHELPDKAINLNVEGKRLAGMNAGFGRMWQKTYTIPIAAPHVSPQQVVKVWRENFGQFWPKAGRFYGPLTSISPGDVALLNLSIGGPAKLSTGIFVLYADDVSFSFINPEGHLFAGMITFSASEVDGVTVAQVQALIRASDPFYELTMPVTHRKEDRFWRGTLRNLAHAFGVDAQPEMTSTLIDKKRQWSHWRNIKNNAAMRSMFHTAKAPFRAVASPFRRSA
jgi:hypothetical protein